MKVLHVLPSIAPQHGGPTAAGLALVRALRTVGTDARIVTTDDDMGGRLAVPLNQWMEHQGVPVFFLPRVRSRQHTLIGFTYAPRFVPWLRGNLAEFEFVHVHTVFSFPATTAMWAARRRAIPYAVRPLGQLCDWSLGQRASLKRAYLALVARKNIDRAVFLHATSRKEAEETMTLGFQCEAIVEPHGIETPPVLPDAKRKLREQLGVPAERPLVVFLSRLHEVKGVEVLLDACARLRDLKFDLVIAGSGNEDYVKTLKARTEGLGLPGRVHWIGFVEGEAKWRTLQGSDVFVLPSRSESFGIAVLEAMACGLPVVVSDRVPVGDEVAKNALGSVVPGNAEAVAGALREWLKKRERRRETSCRSVEFVLSKYSWAAVARRLVERYRKAVQVLSVAARAGS